MWLSQWIHDYGFSCMFGEWIQLIEFLNEQWNVTTQHRHRMLYIHQVNQLDESSVGKVYQAIVDINTRKSFNNQLW
jgi:hypothetical protein